jgi:hypothetical protein
MSLLMIDFIDSIDSNESRPVIKINPQTINATNPTRKETRFPFHYQVTCCHGRRVFLLRLGKALLLAPPVAAASASVPAFTPGAPSCRITASPTG